MDIAGWKAEEIHVPFASASSEVSKALQIAEWPLEWPYGSEDFRRRDEDNDSAFYNQPRLVTHIDDEAISALQKFYSLHFDKAPRGKFSVLDLCSSWLSHYPAKLKAKRVAITGMVEKELEANKQATEFHAQDLNVNPKLPYGNNEFDFVTNAVSIDYLTRPEEVFREMHRVLKPGGVAIISFSTRCFNSKAISMWRADLKDGVGHCQIVGNYFNFCPADGWREITAIDISPGPRTNPLWVVQAMKSMRSPTPKLRSQQGMLAFKGAQKLPVPGIDSKMPPPQPPPIVLPAVRQEAIEAASVEANMKPPPAPQPMSGDMQCHGINSFMPESLAIASAGTLAGALFWRRRFVEIREGEIRFLSGSPEETSSARQLLTLPLNEIDEVALSSQTVSLHCRNPQISVQLFAASETEASSWAAAIKASAANSLSSSLPFGWDVQAMLSTDHASSARLVHKETLPTAVVPLCQRLLDHCYVCKITKDRRNRIVPLRLELVDIQRVQNGAAWMDYSRARNRLRGSAAAVGTPRVLEGPRQSDPLVSDDTEAQVSGRVRSLQDAPVLTSTLANPSLTRLLGGELDSDANEHWLFHGTSSAGVQGISDKEFRLDFAGSHRGTLYGKGIYLAECTSKADEYSEEDEDGYCYMLICRAVLGKINHNTDVRPKKDILETTKSQGYNSLLGDRWAAVGTFREFVLFDPNQVYPAFILRYRRWQEATFARAIRDAVDGNDQDAASRIIPLTALLTDEYPDKTARYRLALLLGAHSEVAVPELCRSLSDHRFRVRRGAVLALMSLASDTGQIKGLPKSVPSLIQSLSDEAVEIRKCAARTLERLSDHASTAAPALIRCLQDSDAGMRAAAAGALGQLGSHAASALPTLVPLASEENEQVRVAAVAALGTIGAQLSTSSEVPTLCASLEDNSAEVRCAAATSLGQLRSAPGAQAINNLSERLKDPQAMVRRAVVKALGMFGLSTAPALPAMILCMKDSDHQVRRATAVAFETLGIHAQPAAQALIEGLRDSNENVRRACAAAMGRLWKKGAPADLSVLQALIRVGLIDQVADVRAATASSLADFAGMGQLGQHVQMVEEAMTVRLKDSDSSVRNSAQAFLAHIRPASKNKEEGWRGDPAKIQDKLAHKMNWRRTEHQMMAIKASGVRFE
eukprot:TRINITY_DN29511_c0_g1_i1.p1 TRINITY_DN29511_c0_g1~~TRINITY_DN29511_c0_g1_i1.p1  ORF type:complete len:1153 (-),score=221.36 TRINITY_DN29511_c0_g1_i1:98-3556(-)